MQRQLKLCISVSGFLRYRKKVSHGLHPFTRFYRTISLSLFFIWFGCSHFVNVKHQNTDNFRSKLLTFHQFDTNLFVLVRFLVQIE